MITTILDMNHGDLAHADLAKVRTEGGIVALFLKASQGKDWRDPAFRAAIVRARDLGFLLGAYHFGSNSSPGEQQADWFLNTIVDAHEDLSVVPMLDWETNPDKGSGTMSLENARRFVAHVHERTGVWPVFYSFTSFIASHMGTAIDPVLAHCPLFQAQYGPKPRRVQPTWDHWTLWQYTNGGDGPPDQHAFPRKTPGVGGCDRSAFDGDETALCAWWASMAATF